MKNSSTKKSKITWSRLGDDCTTYFHASMKSRAAKNRILSFIENGIHIDEYGKVVGQFLAHFQTFKGTVSRATGILDSHIIACGNVLTIDQHLGTKEVKEAMCCIGINNNPGLDGFGSGFFKDAWNIVGGDVVSVVNKFFT